LTQTKEERRLQRIAHRMNERARRYRAGEITAADLGAVVYQRPRACHYCGIGLEVGQGTFDHGQPLDREGPNAIDNIVRSCYSCNRRKFTKNRQEFVAFQGVQVKCPIDGTVFTPRYAEWANGRAKYCSRSCAAKSRFHRGMYA
jgi:hypothetical protein